MEFPMHNFQIIDTNADNILQLGVCGYKSLKRPGFPEKVDWLRQRSPEGLKIKTLYSETRGTQGMIEYVPGEFCWRPVAAKGYLFIHCLFVGFKKEYKGQGYASQLLDICETDARDSGQSGVAVVTRAGSFMAGHEIFLKRGYEIVDRAGSDFELLVKKFNADAPLPRFKPNLSGRAAEFGPGLVIFRADQCPYTVKNVAEICEAAEKNFGLTPQVIDLKNYADAQNSPCAFGTFCILYQGKVIAEHPISKTRFVNIIKKLREQ
jgi:GNAT superfamily N-acetyltransferase